MAKTIRAALERLIQAEGDLVVPYDECGPVWHELIAAARAAIAADRARRPAPEPVPVSERLPEAGDCAPWPDEPGEAPWCWVFVKDLLDEDSWDRRPVTCLTCHPPMYTHWLPAHALPLPGGEVK